MPFAVLKRSSKLESASCRILGTPGVRKGRCPNAPQGFVVGIEIVLLPGR
jgi:hypothetical protein